MVLRGLGLNRLNLLEPRLPVVRYERKRPGEMIHLDIKSLGRFESIGHRISGDRTCQSKSRHVAIDGRTVHTHILSEGRKGLHRSQEKRINVAGSGCSFGVSKKSMT